MINSIQTRQVMHIYLCNPALSGYVGNIKDDKKLSYRRGTVRCVVSIKILGHTRNSAETTYTTSPDQIDGMKLEI